MADLTPKQQRFVDEYLVDLNATQAALRAGYSANTAQRIGSENLSKPLVAEAIFAAKSKRSEKTGIDAAWVLERLAQEAEADVADLYDAAGDIKAVDQWPEIWRKGLVTGVDVLSDGGDTKVTKMRFSDRIKRIELIGRHVDVQAFADKLQVEGTLSIAERLAKRRKERRGD